MCDVFISYKSEDSSEALWLKNVLETNDISCWMAPASIVGGSNYAQAIPEAIHKCKIFLLLLSEKTQQSTWVSKEINLAVNERKVIMPYMIEDCKLHKEFNFYLSDVQRYDAYQCKSDAIKKMVMEMWALLGKSYSEKEMTIPGHAFEAVGHRDSFSEKRIEASADKKRTWITALWFALSYLFCIPSGVIATCVYLGGKILPRKAPACNRVARYINIVGATVGFLVFLQGLYEPRMAGEFFESSLYCSIAGIFSLICEFV